MSRKKGKVANVPNVAVPIGFTGNRLFFALSPLAESATVVIAEKDLHQRPIALAVALSILTIALSAVGSRKSVPLKTSPFL